MPLFRRKRSNEEPPQPEPGPGPATRTPAGPARRIARDGPDWRSYDPIAETYARVHAPRTALPAADLVEIVGVGAGARVLDVGTGTGVAARAAAAAAGSTGIVIGVDPAVAMMVEARRAGAGIRYAAAEAIDLPFRPETFDAVVSTFALSHFDRAETALFDIMRVLRREGRLGVALWAVDQDEFTGAWTEVAEEFAEHEILQDAYRRAMPSAERLADPARLKDVLHEAGLRDIRVERRQYRFEMTSEEYLQGREASSIGRFLRQMLGDEFWETFRRQTREVFAARFPPAFNDFRDVLLAAGHKPG